MGFLASTAHLILTLTWATGFQSQETAAPLTGIQNSSGGTWSGPCPDHDLGSSDPLKLLGSMMPRNVFVLI